MRQRAEPGQAGDPGGEEDADADDGAEAGQASLGNYKTCVFTSNFAYDCADAFLMRHRDDFRRRGIELRADDPEDVAEAAKKGGKKDEL